MEDVFDVLLGALACGSKAMFKLNPSIESYKLCEMVWDTGNLLGAQIVLAKVWRRDLEKLL